MVEQQLESLTTARDVEPEDNSYREDLEHYSRHKININTAAGATLASLQLLHPIQIDNLFAYIRSLGPLDNLHELQAIPGWDLSTIKSVLPYVAINDYSTLRSDIKSAGSDGQHTFLFRYSQTLERSKDEQRAVQKLCARVFVRQLVKVSAQGI